MALGTWRRDSSFPTPDVPPRSSLLGDEALNVSDLPGDPTSRCVDFHVCVGQPGIWGSYRMENIPTWWFQLSTHLKNMQKSNWIISPQIGVNINIFLEVRPLF